MNRFGEHIRKLREDKALLQREVAAGAGIDVPMLSKIEHGERKPKKETVLLFADILNGNKDEMLSLLLADKVYDLVKDEDSAKLAMQVAEEEYNYRVSTKAINRQAIIASIRDFFIKDGRVERAYIFGSFARGDADYKSDIDMLVEVPEKSNFSYFDLADIQFHLGILTKKKIDIGFYGSMREGIWNRVKPELILIYER